MPLPGQFEYSGELENSEDLEYSLDFVISVILFGHVLALQTLSI
jgi:hypothetical protein